MDKIILGDAFEVLKTLPDKSVDLVMTDIPYLMSNAKAGKGYWQQFTQAVQDELQDKEIADGVDISWVDECIRVLKRINMYIWMSKAQIPEYLNYFIAKGCSFEILVWIKPDAMPLHNCKYNSDKEYCLYFRKNGYCQPRDNYYARTYFMHNKNIEDKNLYGHPTCKPVGITKILIENSTHEGDVVLDPFLGSGTTAVAAYQTKRHYIGIEKNEKFYNTAVTRIEEEKKHLDLPLTF